MLWKCFGTCYGGEELGGCFASHERVATVQNKILCLIVSLLKYRIFMSPFLQMMEQQFPPHPVHIYCRSKGDSNGRPCFMYLKENKMTAELLSYWTNSDCTTTYRPLTGLLPSPFLVLAYIISGGITVYSEAFFCCDKGWTARLIHISIGALCFAATTVTMLCTETKLVRFVRSQFLSQYMKKGT